MRTSPRHKAVIFDLDDTLLRSVSQKWAHHRAVAKEYYGFDLTDEELLEHWGKPLDEMIGHLYHHSDTPENMHDAMMSLDHRFEKELFDDAVDGVSMLLNRGIAVGIVTSTSTSAAMADLERFHFPTDRMVAVLGHDDCRFHKPDRRVFDEILAVLESDAVKKAEVVYVGDSLLDHQAAINAGIDFIGVTTGLVTSDDFERAGVAAVESITGAVELILQA